MAHGSACSCLLTKRLKIFNVVTVSTVLVLGSLQHCDLLLRDQCVCIDRLHVENQSCQQAVKSVDQETVCRKS